ncbi:MAG TPA: adenosylcobinamide amidohydrolase [Halococcus sp.]|nr:adenosylcobinamide amidohydrolase [Halococcus sp.]
MFETTVSDGVLRLHRSRMRWLSTGWNGGFERAEVAYNISVPEGWERTDLDAYIEERRARAGFTTSGPTLLTGVDMKHARGARLDSVVVYATAGVSNPAALPMEPTGEGDSTADSHSVGTVNLIVGTTRSLDDAALANLLAVVVEAKTATLLSEAGFPGTTTDAVIVGSDETGDSALFSGSATVVGAAARACVREAVRASFRSRYAERDVPRSVVDAGYGIVTNQRAEVFTP